MSGESGGWNGNRDFLGEGGRGEGSGIAWDSTQSIKGRTHGSAPTGGHGVRCPDGLAAATER
jgi:hypothetical protein